MHRATPTFLILLLTCAMLACQTVPNPPPGASASTPPPSANLPLTGTHWQLTHLGNQPVASLDLPRAAYLDLHAEGQRISGSGGCNRLFGGYQLNGRLISFGSLASTKMACATGMAGEQAVFAALERSQGYSLTGTRLELTDAEGRGVARFEAGIPEADR